MLDPQIVETGIAVILTGSLGVLIHVVKTGLLRSNVAYYKEQLRLTSEDYSRLAVDYAIERSKRQGAEQAHADLADKHNLALKKLDLIASYKEWNGNGGISTLKKIAKGEA